jgi:hypothetical protein
VLEIDVIKSLPHVPMSHPFVERLIGSIRRELLDHTFFWTATDLENKLRDYQCYYNEHRSHCGRDGDTPVTTADRKVIDINRHRWQRHCRGLFELPVAVKVINSPGTGYFADLEQIRPDQPTLTITNSIALETILILCNKFNQPWVNIKSLPADPLFHQHIDTSQFL